MTTIDIPRSDLHDVLNRWEYRALPFPDGLTRLMPLRRKHWLALDSLLIDHGWSVHTITAAAFNLAQDWHVHNGLTLEQELRGSLRIMIAACRDSYANDALGRHNDNRAA